MRKYAYSQMALDVTKIVQDTRSVLKVNSVITAAGVYVYPDGRALKCPKELLKATFTARYAKLTIGDQHPDGMVVMSQDEICGGVEKPSWEDQKQRMHSILAFDRSRADKDVVDDVREGGKHDVSIGFYYKPDRTPGVWTDVYGRKEAYDYVMRDIVIDHVLVCAKGAVGKCTYPRCGVGVDSLMKMALIETDKVEKRGNQWCVIHCHGEKAGQPIKCFGTKAEAEAMHRAILANQSAAAIARYDLLDNARIYKEPILWTLIYGDKEKPSKQWWDNCTAKAAHFAKDPNAFCNWLWHEGEEELRRSMGALKSTKGGKKNIMSEQQTFEECVKQKMDAGMTREDAEDACKEFKIAQAETPWQKCLQEEMAKGKTKEQARMACKERGLKGPGQAGDQETEETAWQKCVKEKMDQGLTREDAEAKCKEQGVEQDQEQEIISEKPPEESLPTPLEQCISAYKDTHPGASDEEARSFCEAEIRGEHAPAEDIVADLERTIQEKHALDERRRKRYRHF